MQTPKARKSYEVPQKASPRSISLAVPQKISPQAISSEMRQKISPQAVCKLKTTGLESDSTSLSNQTKIPKDKSPKVFGRRSPRSPVPEKKRPSRAAELESQISQLQEDLKNTKDQLSLSESCKKQAEQDAEESKKMLLAISSKQEETNYIELQKVSEDLDQELESKLETSQKKNLDESAALVSSLDEIAQLRAQLEKVADSEAELHSLKEKLAETLLLVEGMKAELRDCKESELQAQPIVGETLLQLEPAKRTEETLGSENTRAMEAYDATVLELEKSNARVKLLEELVKKLKEETTNAYESSENGGMELSIEAELLCVTSEVENLRSALEKAEIRYHEEQIRNTVQIKSAYELVEQIKSTSSHREAELEAELKKLKADIEELKANMMDKETELQGICEENEVLNMRLETSLSGQREHQLESELKKTKLDAENLKANLINKEAELQIITEENEMLILGNKKKEPNRGNVSDEVIAELEAARSAEREALVKLDYVTEEADKSNKRAARIVEQLEAAQFGYSEMEAELRRIKVQSDQWRKAAEAAASMISTGNNGRLVERTGSLDSNNSPMTGKNCSPYAEDMDDDDPLKKKNGNMLKRIGVLWKKPLK